MTKNRFLSKRLACLLTTALVSASSFTNLAHAANVTITTTSTVTEANVTTIGTDDLIISGAGGGAGIVVTLPVNTLTTSDILIGTNANAVHTTTLLIAPGASALTIAANIAGRQANGANNDSNTIRIESSVADTTSNLVTISGNIFDGGNALGAIDTLNIGSATTAGNARFTGTVAATAVTVLGGNAGENSTADFANTLTTTTIVLEDSATATSKIIFSGAADKTIAGTIDGGAAGEGTLEVTGAIKTFTGIVGGGARVGQVTNSGTAVFDAAVTATNVTNSGTASFTTLNISGTGTLTGRTNASIDLVQSGTSEVTLNFAATAAADTNTVVNHTGAAGTSLILGKAITNGMVVFNTTDQTAAKILGKVYLPANLVNGQTLTLHEDVLGTNADVIAEAITATNLVLQDTALTDYTAASATQKNVVTSTDKSTSVTASELGVNTNKATGLLQARNAAAAANTAGTDTSSIDAIFNVLNARGGQSATADTDFANQVSPQTDTITGSTIAAKAVTSGVQNVISTRLASLRSGDAYSTGIVTGSHMGTNSGFIQAFGSQVEQKNKGNEFGYDADTTGFAIGFDTKVPGGAVIGISYAHSEADVDGKGTGRAKNDIKTDSVSLYADYATKDGYVEGSITYGKSDNKGSRVINTGGLSNTYASNYDSEQYSFRLSGGIPQSLGGGAFITPFAAATISQIKADAYTETSTTAADALRLRVSQDTVDSQVGTVGVKFHQAIKDGKTTFTPEVKLAVNQEFGDGNITTTNTYQGGGASFKNSTAIEKTSATAGLGLNISSDNLSFNIGYEADVKDKYLGHSAQAKITAKF
jgi:outer membrane autotransporter protein